MGIYRPWHPERTVLYRVLFHYFDRFLAEYESRFEKQYGFLRPTREVLSDLVRKELLSPEWAERILSWRHTGFNVHSRANFCRREVPAPSVRLSRSPDGR